MEIGSKYYSGVIPTHGGLRESQPGTGACETSKEALIDQRCHRLNFAIDENNALIGRVIEILSYSPNVPQQEEVCEPVSNLPQFLEVSIHRLGNCNKSLNELIQELLIHVGELKILG